MGEICKTEDIGIMDKAVGMFLDDGTDYKKVAKVLGIDDMR